MILQNNIEALKVVGSMTKEDIKSIIGEKQLVGFGSIKNPVAEEFVTYDGANTVIGALDNSDTDQMLLAVAEQNPYGVIAGLLAAKKAIGAENAILAVPNSTMQLSKIASEENVGLVLEKNGMTDVRKYSGSLFLHIETLAAIADILTGKAFGTVVSSGKSASEVPFGTKFSDLAKDDAKALFINDRFYPPDILDSEISPDFALGSGVVRVINSKDCIPDYTLKSLTKLREKSCGKCTFCREGLYQLYEIFSDITSGRGKESDIALAGEIGNAMTFSTMCSLGGNAAMPVLSAIKNFGDEIGSHIRKKVCPAGVCSAFNSIYIDPAKCTGCGDCIDACSENAIEGKKGYISMIDGFSCTKCGKCIDVCKTDAVIQTSGRLPKLPERLTRVGRFRRH